jgi:uncharacterized membrane protein
MRPFSGVTGLRLILACCIGLLLMFAIPVFATGGSIGLWLMQSVPLLITLPGLLQHKRRSLQWLGFLVLFYLLQAILQLFTPLMLTRIVGSLSTLFCIILFTAVIVSLKKHRHPVPKER